MFLVLFALTGCLGFESPLAAQPRRPAPVILVLGPPGSGKTLNAQKIGRRYRIPTISMADLLKESGGWGKAGSSWTTRAQVESGELVGDELAIRLLDQRLGKSDTTRGFVLDGFPVTAKQADYLERLGRQRRLGEPLVVHLSVSDSIARERMLKRRRADDQPAIIERRLAEYRAEAELVLMRFSRVITVDAGGSPAAVWKSIFGNLDALLPGPPRDR